MAGATLTSQLLMTVSLWYCVRSRKARRDAGCRKWCWQQAVQQYFIVSKKVVVFHALDSYGPFCAKKKKLNQECPFTQLNESLQ